MEMSCRRMGSETQEMRRRGARRLQEDLSSRPESDAATSRVREKGGSEEAGDSRCCGPLTEHATSLAAFDVVEESAESEMASDGEVLSGLSPPNWVGDGRQRQRLPLGTDVRPAGVHCVWPEWLPWPLDNGSFCSRPRIRRPDGHWADAFPSLDAKQQECSCMKRMWPDTANESPS
ncbi:hypothetical protein N431DRAFT_174369 [Stipitochalara longipes BDJ]|nr:hypothetical protein N431DRAFT_174369 [Stipitochalara longipes BDJ]